MVVDSLNHVVGAQVANAFAQLLFIHDHTILHYSLVLFQESHRNFFLGAFWPVGVKFYVLKFFRNFNFYNKIVFFFSQV